MKTGAQARLRVLAYPNTEHEGHIAVLDGCRLDVKSPAAIPPGSPVRVESGGTVFLGEVRGCRPNSAGYDVSVRLEQAFTLSDDLRRLMCQLAQETLEEPAWTLPWS
jgi:hypothetical protein